MCKHNSQLQLNMNSYLIYLMSLSGHLQTPKILCNVMFSEGYQKNKFIQNCDGMIRLR